MPRSPDTPPTPARYRAVHWAAVACLALGALSAAAFLSSYFLLLPLAAAALGWWALKKIALTPEEFTGTELAWAGIGLAAVFGVTGGGYELWTGAREVPPGYQRIEYIQLQPDPRDPQQKIPESVLKLDGEKIFLKGFMIIPHGQQVRLKRFLVCPTNGECSFHPPNPRPTEIIKVTLTGDLTANYTREPISLGGRLHVDPEDPHGLPFAMDADYLR